MIRNELGNERNISCNLRKDTDLLNAAEVR